MIEFSLLAQLVAFADCGTLSAAAAKLHTSQPAVTRAMKKLEEELGLSLFVRSKNRLALNEVGELAVRHARRLLQEADDMTVRLHAYERSLRTISIAFCSPLPQIVLTPILNNVFDGMTLSADMKDDADFFAKLKGRTYQLAVTHTPPEDAEVFHAKKCGHEDLFLSLPTTSPLVFHPSLRLEHLKGETLLLLNRVGFWMKAVHERTPQTRYLMQEERTTLTELPLSDFSVRLLHRERRDDRRPHLCAARRPRMPHGLLARMPEGGIAEVSQAVRQDDGKDDCVKRTAREYHDTYRFEICCGEEAASVI